MPKYDPKPNRLAAWSKNKSVMDSAPAKIGKMAVRGLSAIMGGDDPKNMIAGAVSPLGMTIGPKAIPLHDVTGYYRKAASEVLQDLASANRNPKLVTLHDAAGNLNPSQADRILKHAFEEPQVAAPIIIGKSHPTFPEKTMYARPDDRVERMIQALADVFAKGVDY